MGLTRIVRIRLQTGKDEHGEAIAAAARRIFPKIIGVTGIEAGVSPDDPHELLLIVRFEDGADVEAYRAHPVHVQFVTEHLRPYMDALSAHNYQVA